LKFRSKVVAAVVAIATAVAAAVASRCCSCNRCRAAAVSTARSSSLKYSLAFGQQLLS